MVEYYYMFFSSSIPARLHGSTPKTINLIQHFSNIRTDHSKLCFNLKYYYLCNVQQGKNIVWLYD
jgi:hypothetical protein